jgi:hypothetical protein
MIYSTYKTLHIYKNQRLVFQCHIQRNKEKLQNTNSPESTTSLSGVVAGCGEKERSGLAVQTTRLLLKPYWNEVDSQFFPIIAVSAGKGFHLVLSISDMKSSST